MCKHSGTHSKTSTLKMFLLPHSTPGVQLSSGALLLSNLHDLLQVLTLKTSLHPSRSKPKPQSTGYLGMTTPPLVPMGTCSESFSDAEDRVRFCTAGLALPVADHHLKQGSHFPSLILQFPAPGAKKLLKTQRPSNNETLPTSITPCSLPKQRNAARE